jgi:hypothetical protein
MDPKNTKAVFTARYEIVEVFPALENAGPIDGQGMEVDPNDPQFTSEIIEHNPQGDAYARYVRLEHIDSNPGS